MSILKCKMCGGDLQIAPGATVAECEYCGTKQTVPTIDDEKKGTLFARANRLRFGCEFDKAAGVYETIIADYPQEAEAYWGLVLCKYGIEYVDDPATGKKIPTCHRSSFDSLMDDHNFEMVMENSDTLARSVYRSEAKQIEELRKGIIEVSSKEEPYDIFICYKETDENGERTIDSVLAQDTYDALTEKGYRVFFSRITLEDKLGQEYEPYIFAALNSAKVMLAFGTDYEYYNAVWVKNEWSRYLQLMTKDKEKHLIPCYKDIDAYDMPKEFTRLQAQDMGKIGAIQDLVRGIGKLLGKKEQAAVAPAKVEQTTGVTLENLLKRGNIALEDEYWNDALQLFDQALNLDADCAKAYMGKAMAEYHCRGWDEVQKCYTSLNSNLYINKNFLRAVAMMKDEVLDKTILQWEQLRQESERLSKCASAGNGTLIKWLDRNATFATIPNDITAIGDGAFENCKNLIRVDIPDGVISIGKMAFQNCSSLTSIDIPNSVTSIAERTFSGCSRLSSINIPDGLTSIGGIAFFKCSSLKSISIPDGVTDIGDWAFKECTDLTSIIIPDSVTNIGYDAFRECSKLTIMGIPGSKAQQYANVYSIPFKEYISLEMAEELKTKKATIEVKIRELESYLSTLGTFKFSEKSQTKAQIAELRSQLNSINEQLSQ